MIPGLGQGKVPGEMSLEHLNSTENKKLLMNYGNMSKMGAGRGSSLPNLGQFDCPKNDSNGFSPME